MRKYVAFRRKKEGKTDYQKRLKLVSSQKLRFVVRKSLKNVYCQVVKYYEDGDKVLVSATTHELKKVGLKHAARNLPAAYLVGYLCGVKAKKAKIKEAILDSGLYKSRKGTIVYAALKGFVDAGIEVPHNPEVFPAEERLQGKHISENLNKEIEAVKAKIGE